MKYIFCSFMFDDVEENVKNSRLPNSVSGHKFQMNILSGLVENGCDVSVVNIPRVRRFPDYKKLIFRRKEKSIIGVREAVNVGFVNLPGINYLTQIFNVYSEIKKIVKKNLGVKIILLVFNTYPAPIIAMRMIKRRYPDTVICDIVGDIYGQFGLKSEKSIHGKLLHLVHNKMDKMASECDVFALATENMAKALNISEKPHIVLEGMCEVPNDSTQVSDNKSERKIVFYAGALLREYGIRHMLRAFSLIQDTTYQFFIAGGGDAVAEIKEFAASDQRIQYLGFITPKEVERYQATATVLINPRTSEHEYVKYSFASKNLECLASGIPYIAHNLPCNPPEYSSYIIYPDNESDEALAEKIKEVCNLSSIERQNIGRMNRKFIKENKNPKAQIERLNILLQTK